ncbi:hypothetical protein KAI46_04410 [bacterium]|nr:hypothetical protein [bacterium]
MSQFSLKLFVLLLLLFSCFSDVGARVEYRVVQVNGNGLTEKEAIYDALKGALEQVNGLQMSAKEESSLKSMFREVDGKSSEYSEEKFQQKVNTSTKGTVKQYEILSKSQAPGTDGQWVVSIEATIAKYVSSQQINRTRLAVIPFIISQSNDELETFSTQITQALVSFLTQTRRFAMLDREFSAEQQRELDFLKREDVPVEEMARIGNKIGTDFIVIGKVEKLIHRTSSITLKRSGKKISSTICGVNVSYRVIDIATGQILSSDSYTCTNKVNGTSCHYPEMALKAASSFGKKISESVFPIAVVSVSEESITLGQGGKTIRIGQKFKLIEYGKNIFDPYTGESLGQEEIPIGLIKIVAVQAKTSRAKIINLKLDIEKYFEPGRFIVRAINEKSFYKKEPSKQPKNRENTLKETFPVKSRRNKFSKDDW